MKLHSPEFERRCWRRLRPAWQEACRKHGRVGPSLWRRQWSIPAGPALGLVAVALLAGYFESMRHAGWSPAALGSLLGTAITCVLMIVSPGVRGITRNVPEQYFLLWLPAGDEVLVRWGWQRLRTFRIYAGVTVALALLALTWEDPRQGWTALILGAIALLSAFAAAGLVMLPFTARTVAVALICLPALALITLLPLPHAQTWLRSFLDEHGTALNWLHPGGWMVTLWQAAMVPGFSKWGLGLAAPLLFLAESVRLSYRRRRAEFSGRAALQRLQEEWTAEQALAPVPDEAALSPEAIREYLRTATPLLPQSAFQRWVVRQLTERERMLLELLGREKLPQVGRVWRRSGYWLPALLLLAVACRQAPWMRLPGGLLVIASIFLFAIFLPAIGSIVRPSWAAAHLPISYRELCRLEAKLIIPSVLLVSPLYVVLGILMASFAELSLSWGAFSGAKVALWLVGLQPFFTVLGQSSDSGDSRGWRWRTAWIIANFVLFGLALLAGLAGVFWHTWPGLLLILLSSVGAHWLYFVHQRAWALRRFDIGQRHREL